jgi:hypothetical protein
MSVCRAHESPLINRDIQMSASPKRMGIRDCHPSKYLSRELTNDVQRQNINVRADFGMDIDKYLRELELTYDTQNCLSRHKITPALRARMVDWMIEVLTNFRCDD